MTSTLCEKCNQKVAAWEPVHKAGNGVGGGYTESAFTVAPIRYNDGTILLGWTGGQEFPDPCFPYSGRDSPRLHATQIVLTTIHRCGWAGRLHERSEGDWP